MTRRASGRWGGREAVEARAYWTRQLDAAGSLPCWRCGKPLTSAMAWQVGHIVDRHAGGARGRENQWPECRRCNLSAGGKIGAAITNAQRRRAAPPRRVVITGTDAERGLRGWSPRTCTPSDRKDPTP